MISAQKVRRKGEARLSQVIKDSINYQKCATFDWSTIFFFICLECIDRVSYCDAIKNRCTDPLIASSMEHYCAKTCGVCQGKNVNDALLIHSEEMLLF